MGARALIPALALVLAAGCADPLPRPSIVEGLRVLAIVADPPEAAPGETVALEAVVVDTAQRDLTYEWSACLLPASADDDDPAYDAEDCNLRRERGEPGVVPLGSGPTAQYTVPADLFEDPSVVREVYGFDDAFPEELLIPLATFIGIDVTISLRVTAGGEVLRAVKRLKASLAPAPNTNPAPVHFVLRADLDPEGGPPAPLPTDYEAPAAGRCLVTPPEGVPEVGPGAAWQLVPVNLPEAYESYDVVGASPDPDEPFQVVETEEVYTFAFFTRAGHLSNDTSSAVDEDEPEPEEHPGQAGWTFDARPAFDVLPLWIVTRDGRGGTTWCYDEVRVAPSG